jgi:hypothetical protein
VEVQAVLHPEVQALEVAARVLALTLLRRPVEVQAVVHAEAEVARRLLERRRRQSVQAMLARQAELGLHVQRFRARIRARSNAYTASRPAVEVVMDEEEESPACDRQR